MSDDGHTHFDFIFGAWHIRNRKLIEVADPACDEWVEFDATSEAFPILGGYGHVDRMYVANPTDGDPFEGFTLRLYEPQSGNWKIWWSSTRSRGVLDPPVEGRFDNEHGVFECEDEIAGRPVLVRFEWLAEDPDAPQWQQSFSYDAGLTWKLNWVMDLTRRTERTPTGETTLPRERSRNPDMPDARGSARA